MQAHLAPRDHTFHTLLGQAHSWGQGWWVTPAVMLHHCPAMLAVPALCQEQQAFAAWQAMPCAAYLSKLVSWHLLIIGHVTLGRPCNSSSSQSRSLIVARQADWCASPCLHQTLCQWQGQHDLPSISSTVAESSCPAKASAALVLIYYWVHCWHLYS